jgi:hypothetical protein
MTENLELPPPERRHVHRRHSRIPVDTVLWALLFGVAIPAAIYAGWFRPTVHAHIAGDKLLQWLGLGFGATGTFILAVVRYPLYIRRYHHGFRPRDLPHHYRPTFWVSYILICVGVLVYLTLIIKQNMA